MNSLKSKIKNSYLSLSHTNKLISDTLLTYPQQSIDITISVLAKKSYCSNSAVMKYINYFGYHSYKVFLADLNVITETPFAGFIQSLQLVEDYIARNPQLIASLLNQIKKSNKVYLFATGQSQIPAIDFRLKCNKLDYGKFIFEASVSTQELLVSTISPNDLVIFISNSGESRELLTFCSRLTNHNKILVTNREESKLAKMIETVICFRNTIESPVTFKEYTRESKYTLLYFFDKVFEKLYEPILFGKH